jgi:hypothetical protein
MNLVSAWDDIYDLVESQSGKYVFSAEFRLLKEGFINPESNWLRR